MGQRRGEVRYFMDNLIYILTFLFFCLGVVIFWMAWRARKRAMSKQKAIHWVFDQANRALMLIESEKPEEILIGLEMLWAYDIPAIRLKAFTRLMELTQHDNHQVAQLSKHVIRLAQSASSSEKTQKTEAV